MSFLGCSVANWGTDVGSFTGALLLHTLGVTSTNFELLWLALVVRIAACALPAALVFVLVPRGSSAEAEAMFRVEQQKQRGANRTGSGPRVAEAGYAVCKSEGDEE